MDRQDDLLRKDRTNPLEEDSHVPFGSRFGFIRSLR
jgi:hypothetical protein